MKQKILLGSDSWIMRILTRIFDLIILNLLFIICSLPVITIGDSLSALYSVTLKMIRNEEGYIVRGFFKAYKENLKQSMIIWIPTALCGVFLYADFRILHLSAAGSLQALRIPLLVLAVILACIVLYCFPMIAYFNCTCRQIFRNLLILCFKHIGTTVLLLAVTGLILLLFMLAPDRITFFAINIFTLIGFSAVALLFSYLLRRIFDIYT